MKASEIKRRADKLIEQQQRKLDNAFQEALTATAFRVGVPEWQKSRALEKLALTHLSERIALVYNVVDEILVRSSSIIAEHELRELFEDLCPTLDTFRTWTFARFVGYNLGVSASLSVDFSNTYENETATATEKLALRAHDVSLSGPFKGRKLVFISCGQSTEDERNLGSAIAAAVQEYTECEGYFAQNQQSLEGLTRDILGALGTCIGFVAVMHKRGDVQTLNGAICRGSVWVEQEIAIVSYRVQVLGHSLALATYIQESIAREGVRQVLLLNSTPFKTADEVLRDFSRRLRDGSFMAMRSN